MPKSRDKLPKRIKPGGLHVGVSRNHFGHAAGFRYVIKTPLSQPRHVVRTPQGVFKLVPAKRNILGQCLSKSPKHLFPEVKVERQKTLSMPNCGMRIRASASVPVETNANSAPSLTSPLVPLDEYDKYEKEQSKKGVFQGIVKCHIQPESRAVIKENFKDTPSTNDTPTKEIATGINIMNNGNSKIPVLKIPDFPIIMSLKTKRASVAHAVTLETNKKQTENCAGNITSSSSYKNAFSESSQFLNKQGVNLPVTANSYNSGILLQDHIIDNNCFSMSNIASKAEHLMPSEEKTQCELETANTTFTVESAHKTENKLADLKDNSNHTKSCKNDNTNENGSSVGILEIQHNELVTTQQKNASQFMYSFMNPVYRLEQQELSFFQEYYDLQKQQSELHKKQADLCKQQADLLQQLATVNLKLSWLIIQAFAFCAEKNKKSQ